MPRNITVTFADGTSHVYQNAPDNVTPEQVAERAMKDFGKHVASLDGGRQPKKTVADRAESGVGTAIRSLSRGSTAGLSDRFVAGANAILPLDRLTGEHVHSIWEGGGFGRAYRENLALERRQNEANQRERPKTALAGEIGGAALSPANKIGAGIKGANALARFARVAAPAAAYGAAQGASDSRGGNALQYLKDGGIGALESVTGAGVGNLLGKGVRSILTPRITQEAKGLIQRGVRLTVGDMMGGAVKSAEDKLTSFPGVGWLIKHARGQSLHDWNRALYDRVLEPIGQKFQGKEVGHEGIERLEGSLSAAYDKILPKVQFRGDAQWGKDLGEIVRKAQTLTGDEQRQLLAAFNVHVRPRLGKGGVMDGKTFKLVESELGKLARQYRPNAPQLAGRIDDLLASMRSNLERTNPVYAPSLKRLNQSWAAFTRVRDAATRRPASHGLITPGDLMQAVKKGDRSVGKGSFARGDALMQREARQAHKVLPSTIPNSGTGDRLAGMGALIESPEIAAAAMAHPGLAAAMTAPSMLYAKPGMNMLRYLAQSHPFPKTRNTLSQMVRKGAPRIGQYLGPAAIEQLAGGGQ